MKCSLNEPSLLSADDLGAIASELSLRQVHALLLTPQLQAERVMEPGTPAFDFGMTHGEMLLGSLRSAQLPLVAA